MRSLRVLRAGSRRYRVAVVVAVIASVLYTAAVSVHPGTTHRWASFWLGLDDVGQCITPVVGALACWYTARRSAGRERLSWALIGAGAASWGAGQLLWTVYEVGYGRQPVSPSLCDAGFLLAPVLIVVGLLGFVDTPAGGLSRLRGAAEGLLIASGLLVAVWTILLAPVVAASRDPFFEELVTVAYPALDAVGIATVLYVATRRRVNAFGRLSVLAAGIVSLAVADSSFWYLTTIKNYDGTNPTDAGWFVGFLLIGFGALALHRRPAPADPGDLSAPTQVTPDGPEGPILHRRWAVVAVPQLVALAGLASLTGHQLIAGRGRFGQPESWMVVTLAGLALANALLVVVENHVLTTRLEDRVAKRTAELATRERYFAALVEHSSDVTTVIAPDLTITWVSQGIEEAYGWDAASLVERRLSDFGDRFSTLIDVLQGGQTAPERVRQVSWELIDERGRQRFADSKITNLVAADDVGGYVINTRDVTDQMVLQGQLRHQAFHDPLTGLANRALFNDRAEHALVRSRRTGTEIGVLMIDLDGFKDVNDGLGHQAGDALLRTTAAELVASARTSDTVARLGGDEFAVLMEDLHGPEGALAAAARMRSGLREAVALGTLDFPVTVSVGAAVSDGTCSVNDLMRDADIAMYRVKTNGKDGEQVFEPWMREQVRERFNLQSELVGALDRGELVLFYQPSFEFGSGRLEGFEALLRWNHPGLGLVAPDKFIALAEESGLIVAIGRWVLQEATRQLGAWTERLGAGRQLTMAINVSPRQIRERSLPDDIRDAISCAGIAPERVVLEITESMLVHEPKKVAIVLQSLKETGVRIAIDDFGTGYSSLSVLKDLPIDILKIDKAFVSSPTGDDIDDYRVLRAILTLAQTLGLQTVGEGVELASQAALLRAAGCDFGQGYLWARPLTVVDAWSLMTNAQAGGQSVAASFATP